MEMMWVGGSDVFTAERSATQMVSYVGVKRCRDKVWISNLSLPTLTINNTTWKNSIHYTPYTLHSNTYLRYTTHIHTHTYTSHTDINTKHSKIHTFNMLHNNAHYTLTDYTTIHIYIILHSRQQNTTHSYTLHNITY